MRVLRIIPSMDPSSGGPCQGLRNIIPELEQLGIINEVICLDDPASSFLGKDPFTIHALGPSKGPWQYTEKLVPWLTGNLSRFEVVIVHALWLYHGYALSKAMKQYKRIAVLEGKKKQSLPRVYVMPHGMLDPYFQKAGERKLKAIRNWAYWKLIESKVINNADGVLFTCEAELLLAREPFQPYHPKKELNIGYGILPPPVFEEQMSAVFFSKCQQVEDEPFILFLSRIHEKKGVDHLLEAYAKVKHSNKNRSGPKLPKLVIAGPGLESVYGIKLQSIVKQFSLEEDVFFPGMLTGNAKWGAFYNCDAFILPSHQENFGIAVAEALACGKPVLISHQVNIWKEIEAAKAGIISDDNTKGVELLLNSWQAQSKLLSEQMGKNAFQCYQDHFAIKPAARRFGEMVLQRELPV